MKKIFILISIVSLFIPLYANEQRTVVLNNIDHKTDTVHLSFCNLYFTMCESAVDGQNDIPIIVENLDETNTIVLFNKPYDEKSLKDMTPSIGYDKVFGGQKRCLFSGYNKGRITDKCSDISCNHFIHPLKIKHIATLRREDNSQTSYRLPMYIAHYKKSNAKKILLLEKIVIELQINITIKPDKVYLRLNQEYDNLMNDIKNTIFCTNIHHKGKAYSDVHVEFERRRQVLRNSIMEVMAARDYESHPTYRGYQQYKHLLDQIEAIDFSVYYVTSCPYDQKPPVTPSAHNCKYCSLSYKDIYQRLVNYFIDIYNGKKNKNQIINDVEALYNCFKKNKKRGSNDSYIAGIEKYYKQIKQH